MILQDTQSGQYSKNTIFLDGYSLTSEDVVIVARMLRDVSYSFPISSIEKVEHSNALKLQLIQEEQPIYGVTTGFGDSCKRQISSAKAADLQRNMVRYHLAGTGPIAKQDITRANILIRINCLARGNSGVRFNVIEQLLAYLKHNIIPLIPERGSVGASGDLIPNSYLAAALIGEGDVWYKDEVKPVSAVLEEIHLEPLVLQAKEGLALINGTSFMSAFACMAYWDASELALVADICTAMASEALIGNQGHFDAFIHEQKPHKGQMLSAQHIHDLLQGSRLTRNYQQILDANSGLQERTYRELEYPIQDKYSIRCAPHIIGVLYDTLFWVHEWIEIEINSSNDNPLFDLTSTSVHNGGNFYGGHIAQAMDSLKTALANIADLLDRQLELVVDEKFNNGLTPNLIPFFTDDDCEAGLHHGFKGMQLACSAMTAEALKMASPMSIFSRSTEAHNQDKVSMGTIAAREACAIGELVQNVAAIHLIALCQAIDLRGKDKMSPQTFLAYTLVRSKVPFLDRDRRMDGDTKHVVDLIHSRSFSKELSFLI